MALIVETVAEVTYTCYLTDEDEAKVRKYVDENDYLTLEDAVWDLYHKDGTEGIYLYFDAVESDMSTKDIVNVREGVTE